MATLLASQAALAQQPPALAASSIMRTLVDESTAMFTDDASEMPPARTRTPGGVCGLRWRVAFSASTQPPNNYSRSSSTDIAQNVLTMTPITRMPFLISRSVAVPPCYVVGDPLFAAFIGSTAAALRIRREEHEKGLPASQLWPTLRRCVFQSRLESPADDANTLRSGCRRAGLIFA
ncbi:hypothetical protein Dda_8459 [Drechslerella dactyloides]|uniref:Uncharacterized protein n=1 Tax=Drechslerella dactyloides TaxID=74499 RepID=A0AAD6IRK3_DREDA|nr:hypothetical protein Dda_8459 [Drechslerella dactyloides]